MREVQARMNSSNKLTLVNCFKFGRSMPKTEKLIELVGKYPMLYNLSHEDYKNTRKKELIWKEIGREIGKSGGETKKKWKNLRDTYAKYIKINEGKTKTGRVTKQSKKWLWADHMEQFRPYINTFRSAFDARDVDFETSSMPESSSGIVESNQQESEPEDAEEDIKPYRFGQIFTETEPATCSRAPDTTAVAATSQFGGKRKGKPSFAAVDVSKHLENENFDATDYLFLAYAKTLKTFSRRRQIMTKMKIAEIMMRQELLHVEEDHPGHVNVDPLQQHDNA